MRRIIFTLLIICITNYVASATNKELTDTLFYSVYKLSDKTTAVVINMADEASDSPIDIAFNKIDELEQLSESYIEFRDKKLPQHIQYYDTTGGVYKLLHNKNVVNKLKPLIQNQLYIYGTKGIETRTIKDVTFAIDECITSIFAFTITPVEESAIGQAIFASTKKLDLIYGSDYKLVEEKINRYYKSLESDYNDNTLTKVFANKGSLFFTYTDDFKWTKQFDYDSEQTNFPTRAIFELDGNGNVFPVWEDSLDLFGIPCD
ncbi:MAG: hypothetical protein RL662_1499 [Bacteroidota bacterium]|jgi:hypothetical protein